jgi:hypothetical protein
MTTQPAQPKLVLRSAVDVAASIPYLLGFAPDDSVALVFFDADYRHVLTARIDWPPHVADFEGCLDLVIDTCRNAIENGADQAQIVLYPPTSVPARHVRNAAAAVDGALQGTGVAVISVGSVADGFWLDLGDPLATRANVNDRGASAAFQWVANGVSYLPDREAVVDRIDGEPTPVAARLADRLNREDINKFIPNTASAKHRRALEEAIYGYLFPTRLSADLDSPALPITLPNDSQILGWALALADRRIREPLLWRFAQMYGDRAPDTDHALKEALAGLSLLVRNTPDEVVGALASCTAALAWQQGNGALAQIAAERGLKAKTDSNDSNDNNDSNSRDGRSSSNVRNVLCDLVFKAVEQGVHPSIWVEMLNSMTLQELRSGQSRKGTDPVKSNAKSVRDCSG